jgi:hypothetical protein
MPREPRPNPGRQTRHLWFVNLSPRRPSEAGEIVKNYQAGAWMHLPCSINYTARHRAG